MVLPRQEECVAYMPNNSWRPDWRDATKYPDPKTTSKQQWAWEFLRRNAHYQADYGRMRLLLDKGANITNEESIDIHETCKRYCLRSALDPAEPLANVFLMRPRTSTIQQCKIGEFLEHAETLPARNENEQDLFVWLSNYAPLLPERPSEVVARVDLALPIADQIAALEKRLIGMQQKFKAEGGKIDAHRYENERYRNYLQLLDAKYLKTDYLEICKILDPGFDYTDQGIFYSSKDRLRKQLKAARFLSEQGYRFLAEASQDKVSSLRKIKDSG